MVVIKLKLFGLINFNYIICVYMCLYIVFFIIFILVFRFDRDFVELIIVCKVDMNLYYSFWFIFIVFFLKLG